MTISAFPLIRNVSSLQSDAFDLLVIGGGIYGAWTAYDAALRGLKVALIEKNDWASGTSSASSKLIHGGLRYLEHYEFALVRHALRERKVLSRIAPHLVRPLDFILPVWKGPRASPLMLSAGLTLYDALAFGSGPVKPHKRFAPRTLLKKYPWVDPKNLVSGFRYGDCQEDDARMTMTVVAAAQSAGAVCANRVQAQALLRDVNGISGARVHDVLGGASFEVRARCIVNSAGPWARSLLGDKAPKVKLIKGTHILLPEIPGCTEAFLLTAPDGRVFFVIPWYGKTLVGTTESEVNNPDEAKPTDAETSYLIAGVKSGLPGLGWTESDVIARYSGVRTLQAADTGSLAAVSREFDIVEPEPRLVLPIGGKYTTSRCDAVEIVDRVFKSLGMKKRKSRTHDRLLPGSPEGEFEPWLAAAITRLRAAGVDPLAAGYVAHRHGARIDQLLKLIAADASFAHRLHPDAPFIRAEVKLSFRDEMALSADDALRRRMPLRLLVGSSAEIDLQGLAPETTVGGASV
ncbi:MAG: FAD-dependent oxidoreductase [Panacagrimonas sp.]